MSEGPGVSQTKQANARLGIESAKSRRYDLDKEAWVYLVSDGNDDGG